MSLQEKLQNLNEIDISEIDFSDIDFNSIGTWPLAGKLVIWVTLFTLILVGLYQFNISPLLVEFHKEEQKEQSLREEFEQKVNDSANLEAYRAQMIEMEASFEALLKQLPQDTEVPGLLDDISTKGEDSGLTFSLIDLKPEKKEEYYVELPIEISVFGGYHDFGSFVSGIAALPRIVTLNDFSITPVGASRKGLGEGAKKGQLSLKITAKTYRYRSPDDRSSAGAKKCPKGNKGKKCREEQKSNKGSKKGKKKKGGKK